MPRTETIVTYDLLISCPSDILEEIEVINDVVDEFNKSIGKINGIRIETKYWKKDSYPQSGGKAQALLNNQFVLGCDMAVAIFWTRFGTPTDEYKSGSEEEIEKLIQEDKQVFLYFSDCPTNPSMIDQEQQKKVMDFRKKYENKGIYSVYSSIEDFRREFTNHITLYFLNLKNLKDKNEDIQKQSSDLKVIGVNNNEILDNNFKISTLDLINSEYIKNNTKDIIEAINRIKEISIPFKEKNNEMGILTAKALLEKKHSVELSLEEQDTIKKFAQENKLNIEWDKFFYLGNLEEYNYRNPLLDQNENFYGTDSEKEKYNLLLELLNKIISFNQIKHYFSALQEKKYIALAVSNIGTKFDEDIDIEIKIEKGKLCRKNDLPYPEDSILEEATYIIKSLLKKEKTVNIEEYSDYLSLPSRIRYSNPMLGKSVQEKIEERKEDYNDILDNILCYKIFEDDRYDILKFKIKYLKHHTSMFFPAVLILNDDIKSIGYKIISKYASDIIKDKIEVYK